MSATERAIKAQLRKAQAIQAMHFGALEERARIIRIIETHLDSDTASELIRLLKEEENA